MRIVALFLLMHGVGFASGRLTVINGNGVVIKNGKSWISPRKNIEEFTEIAPSWNITAKKPDSGFVVSMRLYGKAGAPSPWIRVGEWRDNGTATEAIEVPGWEQSVGGRVLLFYNVAKAFQFKIEAGKKNAVRVRKLFAYSDIFRLSRDPSASVESVPMSQPIEAVSVPIPFHSQFEIADADLARRSCLPTALAMVLEHFGRPKTVAEVTQTMLFGAT